MDRLHTMARFAEPEEETPVCQCDYCLEELYEGDTVYKVDGEIYCSAECVADAVANIEELESDF